MQIKNLEVSEIILKKIDSKTRKLYLQVNFSSDNSLQMEVSLEENFELLVDKLLKQIKSVKKPEPSHDNFNPLDEVSIVNIKNEEDIKERAPKRLYLLDRRLENLNQTTHHKEYISLFHQLSTLQETIYQSNGGS